jgi:hypothetical protein
MKHMTQSAVWQEMCRPANATSHPYPAPFESQAGCGIFTSVTSNGVRRARHSGACAGFRALLSHLPDLGVGLGVLSNSTEGSEIANWIESWVISKLTPNKAYHDEELARCASPDELDRTRWADAQDSRISRLIA